MEKTFNNKVVIVTGGAQGIGQCIADQFKMEGAHVCVIGECQLCRKHTKPNN